MNNVESDRCMRDEIGSLFQEGACGDPGDSADHE